MKRWCKNKPSYAGGLHSKPAKAWMQEEFFRDPRSIILLIDLFPPLASYIVLLCAWALSGIRSLMYYKGLCVAIHKFFAGLFICPPERAIPGHLIKGGISAGHCMLCRDRAVPNCSRA